MNETTPGVLAGTTWAQRLIDVRERHALSQEDLAHRLGVSFATVNRWERERAIPAPRTVLRLTTILDALAQQEPVTSAVSKAPSVDLPNDRTSFVGRDRELAELAQSWTSARLLTLAGAGGVGKSRLAVELLRRSAEVVLGVVRLETLTDPSLVAATTSVALKIRTRPGVADIDNIARSLGDARGAILFDTCEHVRETLRPLLRAILDAAPNVRVLATSQAVLGLSEERVWRVPPLEMADREGDALRLFVARARDRRSDFAPDEAALRDAREICVRLDGVPLALELAAGWMSTMTPGQLLRRWDERGELLVDPSAAAERHRTPGASVAWSAGLLTDAEQHLVAELSVFIGTFELEDVEAVASYSSSVELLTRLRRLVDLSWLEFDASTKPSYRMLDTLRAWGIAQLSARDEVDSVRRRLAAHIEALCSQAEGDRFRADVGEWPLRLAGLEGSINAALSWASARDPDLLGRVVLSLLGWWRASGRLAEGRYWQRVVSETAVDDVVRARAQSAEALLALDIGEYEAVEKLASASLGQLDHPDDSIWAARALTALSSAAKYRGDMGAARRQLETAVTRLESHGDTRDLSIALNNLGALSAEMDDLDAARDLYRDCLRLKRRLGDPRSIALTMANLADVQARAGETDEALASLREAAEVVQPLGDSFLMAFIDVNLGETLLRRDEYSLALERFQAARTTAIDIGVPRFQALAACGIGQVLHRLDRGPEALVYLRESRDIAERISDEIVLAQVRQAMTDAVGSTHEVRPPRDLSPREVEVLGLLIAGLRNDELGARLHISVTTVQRHLANIYRKLGVRNRTEAAALARDLGFRPTA